MNMTRRNLKSTILGLIAFFLVLTIPAIVCGQYQGETVKKDRLIRVLRSKQLQSREIIRIIQESGVDFRLTPGVENELIDAGARPTVIEAVRKHYRYAKPEVVRKETNKNKNNDYIGTPLTKTVVLMMLKNKTPDSVIKKQVKQNGVSFQMNDQIAAEIAGAGGGNDFIKLVAASYNGGSSNIAANLSPGNSYGDLIQQAIIAYDGQRDLNGANQALQRAVKLEPNNPQAHQLLGSLNLYGFKNFSEAEKNWKTAISYGGSAVLRVIHDHGGFFLKTCQGSLYIARDTVRYESDDNKHTFEASDHEIKEVKVNSIFKRLAQFKQGSFKIELRKEAKADETNFSFVPQSGGTNESKMIIRLIGKKRD